MNKRLKYLSLIKKLISCESREQLSDTIKEINEFNKEYSITSTSEEFKKFEIAIAVMRVKLKRKHDIIENQLRGQKQNNKTNMKIVITESQYDKLFNDLDDSFFGTVEETNFVVGDLLTEAEYQGRKVQLGKIMQGDVKKFKVYVKNDKGNVVKVNFGFGGKSAKGKRMVIKKNNPARRKSFRARMNCDSPGPRWKARYWACRTW
jgi:hypothetical protein